jgi:hypothetical protein
MLQRPRDHLSFALRRAAVAHERPPTLSVGLALRMGWWPASRGTGSGSAVGMAVGEGAGVVPGACFIGICPLVPTPGLGVGARIPAGMPGAAGRNPSGLASVEPVRFGAGPAVAGEVAEPLP